MNENWKKYKRKSISEMREYIPGEILDKNISISNEDIRNGQNILKLDIKDRRFFQTQVV